MRPTGPLLCGLRPQISTYAAEGRLKKSIDLRSLDRSEDHQMINDQIMIDPDQILIDLKIEDRSIFFKKRAHAHMHTGKNRRRRRRRKFAPPPAPNGGRGGG